MTCYSGIDLHSNNSVVVVSDKADRVRGITLGGVGLQHRSKL